MSSEIELGMKTAAILSEIATERGRQIGVEGWAPRHDDTYVKSELAVGAAVYALSGAGWKKEAVAELWPKKFDYLMLKPKSPRRDLVRAAALIVAEIERLDRLALNGETGTQNDTSAKSEEA